MNRAENDCGVENLNYCIALEKAQVPGQNQSRRTPLLLILFTLCLVASWPDISLSAYINLP